METIDETEKTKSKIKKIVGGLLLGVGALLEVCLYSYICALSATGGSAAFGQLQGIIFTVVGFVLLMAGLIMLTAKRRRPR